MHLNLATANCLFPALFVTLPNHIRIGSSPPFSLCFYPQPHPLGKPHPHPQLADSEWHWWGHRMSAAFFVWRLTFCYFMSTDINDLLINITLDRARPDSEDDHDNDDNDEALAVPSVWSWQLMEHSSYAKWCLRFSIGIESNATSTTLPIVSLFLPFCGS